METLGPTDQLCQSLTSVPAKGQLNLGPLNRQLKVDPLAS